MKKSMKIAFIVRSTINHVKGGDSMQVNNTAIALRKLNVDVDIKLSTDKIDYGKYDLLHLFNIIRPADHLTHITQSKVPFVISTIYLDYSKFDYNGRSGFQKHILRILGKNKAEYLKNNYRFLKNQDSIASKEYLLGHKRGIKKILKNAKLILPNSESEYQRLLEDYGILKGYHVVPNGINAYIFNRIPKVKRIENQMLCVGQIYGLKNQHSLIEVTRDMDVRLIIIGKPPPNHVSYYNYCRKIAHSNVTFYDFMPQNELIRHYAQSKVHALPSWFETTGLSSLEAGAMGCNLVVGSGGDTKDYFTGKASFCLAGDNESIKKALEYELEKPTNFDFRNTILAKYTWEHAAMETLKAYKKALQID
ncbi:MAG: glycosyltransferase family 4 protein [Bacteroidetes bacterium]|nr:glycosyltransferase family 4 protein [Bacteroidota bacterium]